MRTVLVFSALCYSLSVNAQVHSWIRINLLGYKPESLKEAVWCSKAASPAQQFQLIDAASKQTVFEGRAGKAFGAYGPFKQSCRLNFSEYKKAGNYFLKVGEAVSCQVRQRRLPQRRISEVDSGQSTGCSQTLRTGEKHAGLGWRAAFG